MKDDIASSGSGSGASFGPLTGEPCPTVPWHCQQPYFRKFCLPLAASPAASAALEPKAARVARPAASAANPTERTRILRTRRMCFTSTRLSDGIDERRLALLDHLDGFLERRPEILRIGDRALGPPTLRPRETGIVDVRRVDAGADRARALAEARNAVAPVGQALHVHDLLVIAAVVVHHGEQRDVVMR